VSERKQFQQPGARVKLSEKARQLLAVLESPQPPGKSSLQTWNQLAAELVPGFESSKHGTACKRLLKPVLTSLIPRYGFTTHNEHLDALRANRGEVVRGVIRAAQGAVAGRITAVDVSSIPEEV
jgi:hypothetical protein